MFVFFFLFLLARDSTFLVMDWYQSPRQADLIFTASTVTMKMAPSLVRKSSKMPESFLAMEAITGGMFIQYRFFLFL